MRNCWMTKGRRNVPGKVDAVVTPVTNMIFFFAPRNFSLRETGRKVFSFLLKVTALLMK